MLVFRRAAIFAAYLFLLGSSVIAQDISLVSHDKAIRLDGTFLGFDGQFYRIDTPYGELTVDSSGVLCEGPACPNLTDYVADLRVAGTADLISGLWPALLQGFADANDLEFEVTETSNGSLARLNDAQGRTLARFEMIAETTGAGLSRLLDGGADMVLASRAMTRQELALARSAGLGDLSQGRYGQVIALDAILPITPDDAAVTALPMDQIRGILTGDITDWSHVGGPDARINLHLPSPEMGFGQAIGALVPKLAADATFHGSLSDLLEAVRRDPFALGLSGISSATSAQTLAIRGGCGVTLRATRQSVKAEEYPLTAPMFLYRPARRLPKIGREFMAFLSSESAQSVVRTAGYIDQLPEMSALADQGERLVNAILHASDDVSLTGLQKMVAELDAGSRLTTSFRFEAGSSRLDAQSRSNVELLAQTIAGGRFDGESLMFVGFSDGQGPADANEALSVERADAVMQAVMAATEGGAEQTMFAAVGYGEAMPLACDNSDWGRFVNRRVEVWVKPQLEPITDSPQIGN
ncbi:substrate-binding domain-containing protein [Donghicola sp. XS_ASV15]|uniref:substrate-binding domain-containing protein n=1 Tax=Donghicola sp. XS_ASV15 TaxID=3241295 RepID=UPI003515150C